jgi:hypothetical protein
MDVIAGQDALLNAYAHFGTGLPNDVAQPQLDITTQNLEPIFCHPNQVISVVRFGMATGTIGHDLFSSF